MSPRNFPFNLAMTSSLPLDAIAAELAATVSSFDYAETRLRAGRKASGRLLEAFTTKIICTRDGRKGGHV